MSATGDLRDQLESVALNTTDAARYIDDAAGQRIAKVVDKGRLRHTMLTLWGIEYATKHNMAATPPRPAEERGAPHMIGGQQRSEVVETRTVTTAGRHDDEPRSDGRAARVLPGRRPTGQRLW
jgi:hypothetical protein